MTKKLRLLPVVCLLITVSDEVVALSECVDPASPDVWKVESGGLWNSGGQRGNYRVVLTKVGVEHAQDRIQVQISRINGSSREIVRCVDIDAPGLHGYVEDIRIRSVNDSAAVIALSIEMKAMEGVILQHVFLVSASGAVKTIQEEKYTDISDFE